MSMCDDLFKSELWNMMRNARSLAASARSQGLVEFTNILKTMEYTLQGMHDDCDIRETEDE